MNPLYGRTALIAGDEGVRRLKNASVAVVGLGGVGGYAAEVIARAGVGRMLLVDGDRVEATNKNRQLIADDSTEGRFKAEAFAERIKKINAEAETTAFCRYFDDSTAEEFFSFAPDFIVDAIDSVKYKTLLIVSAQKLGYNIISAMGAGNRLELPRFEITDIYKTRYDPLAKKMRALLKKEGVKKLDVCAACEPCAASAAIGSMSYVPAAAGITIGAHVIRRIIG